LKNEILSIKIPVAKNDDGITAQPCEKIPALALCKNCYVGIFSQGDAVILLSMLLSLRSLKLTIIM